MVLKMDNLKAAVMGGSMVVMRADMRAERKVV